MVNISTLSNASGRAWGVLGIIAVAVPLPWLFTLMVLSSVLRSHPYGAGSGLGAEQWAYGLIATLGLLLFPILFLIALALAITAVRRPHRVGRMLGWIAIGVVIVAIPLLWFGYGVWINP